jgi:hypothetical protein
LVPITEPQNRRNPREFTRNRTQPENRPVADTLPAVNRLMSRISRDRTVDAGRPLTGSERTATSQARSREAAEPLNLETSGISVGRTLRSNRRNTSTAAESPSPNADECRENQL